MGIIRLIGLGAVLLAATTARATVANDICAPSANPCTVTTAVPVADLSILDFGTRALVITSSGSLSSGLGSMTIRAGSLVVQAGGRILAIGRDIDISTTGAIQVLTGTSIGRIESSGVDGGSITLDAGTTVQIDGDVRADGTGTFGTGGFVDVSGTTITTGFTSRVTSKGGRAGDGDEVALTADGNMSIAGLIDVSGGLDGGTITLDGVNITMTATGEFNLSSGEEGFGDEVDVSATGNVSFSGPIDGSAGGNIEFGGAGAGVTIFADGSVTLNSEIELTGGGRDGEGGEVFVDADGNIAQGGSIHSAPDGSFGLGGDVTLNSVRGTISVNNVDVRGATGGTIDISGNEAVTIGGQLEADGTDARIAVTGCAITITTLASLSAEGLRGINTILARGLLRIQGSVTAGQSNRFEFRTAATPPVITGSVVPPTAPVLNTALLPCGAPPPATTTTSTRPTTTTSSTTTTSTIRATTTTSSTTTSTIRATTTTSSTTTSTIRATTTTSSTTTTTTRPTTTTTVSTTSTTGPPVTTTTISSTTTTTRPVTTTTVSTTSTTAPSVTTTTIGTTSTTAPQATTTTLSTTSTTAPQATTTTLSTTSTTVPQATTTTLSTTSTTVPQATTTTLSTTSTTVPQATTTTLSTTSTTTPPTTTTTIRTTTTTVQQTTTTVPGTTTSTTQPTVTTSTSTSTTTLASTTTTTTPSSTTTTTVPLCDPGNPSACNDGDTCTRDSCDPATGCVHTPITSGIDAVTCSLGEQLEAVASIPVDDLGGPQSKNRITRRLERALRLMEKVRNATGRLAVAGPKKTRTLLQAVIRDLERGIRKGSIDPTVGNALLEDVRGTLESLQPLIKRR